jgi:hypothetical protein
MEMSQLVSQIFVKLLNIDFKKKGLVASISIIIAFLLILSFTFVLKYNFNCHYNGFNECKGDSIKFVFHSKGKNVLLEPNDACQAYFLFEKAQINDSPDRFTDNFAIQSNNDTNSGECFFHYKKIPIFSLECDSIKTIFYDLCLRFTTQLN